jgi:hypothetical protein
MMGSPQTPPEEPRDRPAPSRAWGFRDRRRRPVSLEDSTGRSIRRRRWRSAAQRRETMAVFGSRKLPFRPRASRRPICPDIVAGWTAASEELRTPPRLASRRRSASGGRGQHLPRGDRGPRRTRRGGGNAGRVARSRELRLRLGLRGFGHTRSQAGSCWTSGSGTTASAPTVGPVPEMSMFDDTGSVSRSSSNSPAWMK